MRVLVASAQWPSEGKTGLGIIAAKHLEFLIDGGYEVFALSSSEDSIDDKSIGVERHFVLSRGSGALYSPLRISRNKLVSKVIEINPKLIIVQGWQTGFGETIISVAKQLGIKVVVVSHGVSVHPFTKNPRDFIRSFGWLWFRIYTLKKYLKSISALTVLDLNSKSYRFFDREMAYKLQTPVFLLPNTPLHQSQSYCEISERKSRILVIGYFSYVKNQLAAIRMLRGLPLDIELVFLGKKSGAYYLECVRLVQSLGFEDRVQFLSDEECDVSKIIAESILILSVSITEALPISLIEASAAGTPFVARCVGAISSLEGGRCFRNDLSIRDEIIKLLNSPDDWMKLSIAGLQQYNKKFTNEVVKSNFLSIIKSIVDPRGEDEE